MHGVLKLCFNKIIWFLLLNWMCQLRQVVLSDGHKMVIVIVVVLLCVDMICELISVLNSGYQL